jgi:hypothetical protein
MKIQGQSKALKTMLSTSALLTTPLTYVTNEYIVNHSTIAKEIKASNFVPFRSIPRTRVIVISYKNLLKLLDSGLLSQKSVDLINNQLFEQSYNDYKSSKVFNYNI